MSIVTESTSIKPEQPAAPVVEQPKAEVVDASVKDDESLETTEASETSETESEEQEEATEGEESKEEDKPKKKSGYKRKIDKMTREIDLLRQELAKVSQPKEQPPEVEKKTAKAEGEPNPDDFESHLEWVKEWNRWDRKREQAENEQKQKQEAAKSEIQKAKSMYAEKVNEFKKTHPDYEDVMAEADDAGIRIPFFIENILLEAGPQLAYELAKDHDELKRIASLDYGRAVYELGKKEAAIALKSQKPQEQKTTKAPEPISPIGGKGNVVPRKTIYDPNLSQKEYEELRAKQRAK